MLQISENANEQEVIEFLKLILTTNPNLFSGQRDDYGCFMRALRRGEPSFTVVAQDETSVPTVIEWLRLNSQLTPDRVGNVIEIIEAMKAWPVKKSAD